MPLNLSWPSSLLSNVFWLRIFRHLFPEVSFICHLSAILLLASLSFFPWRKLWSWEHIHFFLAVFFPFKTILSFHKIGGKTKSLSFLNLSVGLLFCFRHNQLPLIKLLFSRASKLKCPIWEMKVKRGLPHLPTWINLLFLLSLKSSHFSNQRKTTERLRIPIIPIDYLCPGFFLGWMFCFYILNDT